MTAVNGAALYPLIPVKAGTEAFSRPGRAGEGAAHRHPAPRRKSVLAAATRGTTPSPNVLAGARHKDAVAKDAAAVAAH
jgi:hypothetical protein